MALTTTNAAASSGPVASGEPRAAYVHVPFCAHRCGYCNFTLVAGRDDLIEDYLRAVEIELAWLRQPRGVDSIFLGGGTPTHLNFDQLDRLLSLAARWFAPAEGCEWSIEANPADVTPELVDLLAQHGVSRVSLGAQSFNPNKLRNLDRDHGPETIESAVAALRGRVKSISFDLIFGVPGEDENVWSTDLGRAIELAPDHVSTYGLTIERGTRFGAELARGQLRPLDEETERSLYAMAIDTLGGAGFDHYEVSNFAQAGHRCRHNEAYWLGAEYFAVGPGAARYVDGRREMNHRSTTTYLKRVLAGRSPVAQSETLSPEDRARERLVFGLRRMEGVRRDWFASQTGFSLDQLVGRPLAKFVSLGVLADDGQTVRLTRKGLFVSDSIWPEFLSA